MNGTATLVQALENRASSRSFSSEPLPPQVLSDLLWAAFGINRPDSGRRTAPSAMNVQEIDIYVATAQGLYLYDATGNVLRQVGSEDIRAATGMQDYVAIAPVSLIFVADLARMSSNQRAISDQDKLFLAACDTGFISQNVYLFSAVNGLATVVRASIDRDALARLMGLGPEQRITLAQCVGYPGPQD